jgi:hypothetical protein
MLSSRGLVFHYNYCRYVNGLVALRQVGFVLRFLPFQIPIISALSRSYALPTLLFFPRRVVNCISRYLLFPTILIVVGWKTRGLRCTLLLAGGLFLVCFFDFLVTIVSNILVYLLLGYVAAATGLRLLLE